VRVEKNAKSPRVCRGAKNKIKSIKGYASNYENPPKETGHKRSGCEMVGRWRYD